MPTVNVTLLPREEHSLGSLEGWLKKIRGNFIRVEYTAKNIRLFWQKK